MSKLKSKYYSIEIGNILLFIGLISLATPSYGQDNGICQVKFNFQHSLRIPYNCVSVEFQRFGNSVMVHVKSEPMDTLSEKWDKTKLDYSFELSLSEFDKIVGAVQKINCEVIVTGMGLMGFDGSTCEISYGCYATGISFKVWTPLCDTKERNLEAYLEACKLILKTAKLDPKQIL